MTIRLSHLFKMLSCLLITQETFSSNPEVPWWADPTAVGNVGKFSSEESVKTWWKRVKKQHHDYVSAIPKEVLDSITKAASYLVLTGPFILPPMDDGNPILYGQDGKPKTGAPLRGRFSCGKEADYALIGIKNDNVLAAALTSPELPSIGDLRKISVEYMGFYLEKPAEVWVGNTNWKWQKLKGSHVENLGSVSGELKAQIARSKFVHDLPWLVSNKCELLFSAYGDYWPSKYVFDRKSESLVLLPTESDC